MPTLNGTRQQRMTALLTGLLAILVLSQAIAIAQNLGGAPQVNVAVQGQTGAQPEGAFLNLVNWVGNVIAPVGAGLALAGGLVSYIAGRGVGRYVVTALGCLAIFGITRLLEFWIAQGRLRKRYGWCRPVSA